MRNVSVIQSAPECIPSRLVYSPVKSWLKGMEVTLSFRITHEFMLRRLAQILQTIKKMFIAYLRIIFHKI